MPSEFTKQANLRAVWACAALVALVAIAAYARAARGEFVWDDTTFLVDNAAFRVGSDWSRMVFEPFLKSGNYFRPLVLSLFVAEVRGFDANPHSMHMVNIGLHALNAMLVTLLVGMGFGREKMATMSYRLACVALGVIYALHPALVEPVAWISGQFDLVVTFFLLAALWADATLASRPLRLILVGVLFLCAALSKEAAATFPVVLVVAHWLRARRGEDAPSPWREGVRQLWKQHGLQYLILVAMGCAYLLMRYWSFGYLVVAASGQSIAPGVRWLLPPYLYAKYLQLAVWPFAGLSPLHEGSFVGLTGMPPAELATALVGLVAGVLAILLVLQRRILGVALLLFGTTLLPVLQLGGVMTGHNILQERYLALPLAVVLGLTGAEMWEAAKLALVHRRSYWLALGAGLSLWLFVAGANVVATVPLWKNDASLWRWAVISAPGSDYARTNLLSEYLRQNNMEPALRLARAIEADRNSSPLGLLNAGSTYFQLGDLASAERLVDRAVAEFRHGGDDNSLYMIIMMRGSILDARNRPAEAAAVYRDAIQLSPLDINPHRTLALSLAAAGDFDEAIKAAADAEELCVPADREAWRQRFHAALDAARASKDGATPQ